MDCFITVDSKVYGDTLMGTVISGGIEPKSIVKVIKTNKQFGLIIDSCEVIVVNVEYPKDYLSKKMLKNVSKEYQTKTVILTIAGCKFTIDKSLYIVSGNGEDQLTNYLESNKKI
jgi:hypothetical protein